MTIRRIVAWFSAKDWRSWLAHALQGFALAGIFGFVSPGFGLGTCFGYFMQRELVRGLAEPLIRGETDAWSRFIEDGLGDLAAPVLAGLLAFALHL